MPYLPPVAGGRGAAVTLINLQTMPCGCVAGTYRASPSTLEFELVEAKGPHCHFYGHRSGKVISLGIPSTGDGSGPEPTV